MDYYDEWGDESGRRWPWFAALAALALLLGVVAWQVTSDDDQLDVRATPVATVASTNTSDVNTSSGSSATTAALDAAIVGVSGDDDSSVTSVEQPSAVPSSSSSSVSPSTTSEPADVAASARTTPPEVRSLPPTTPAATTLPPTTSAVATLPPAPATTPAGYPMSPDGTPLPVVAVFDTTTITITGQVPSQQAKDRLAGLALANSQFPDAQVVDNMVINPAVPISVGVRVIELNSARFPEGTDVIKPDHAAELDRVVSIMNALPHISVLVVGHADQRGDDVRNFRISDARARAVVNYFLILGIQPSRLASRAAGETDLLTLADDPDALALNRRTEFIFYGLLIE